MADGLLNMRSRPYLSENLFDIPVDEGTRGMILPVGKRGGQRSIAFPQMALDAYQSFLAPYQAYSGELGMPSVDNPAFTDATTQFGVDFGLLPALGTAAIAKPSPNVLRMGMGGADTVSGGAVRGPEVDELGFYSQALETAKNLQQAKGTGEQFRKMLTSGGVKPDEIKFTPELEGLLSQPKVTRDEVVGLLQENRIRPEQTMLSSVDSEFEGMRFPDFAEELSIDVAYGPRYIDDRTADMIGDDYYANYVADEATSAGREDLNIEAMRKAVLEDDFSILNAEEDGFVRDSLESLVAEEYRYDPVYRLSDPDSGYEIVGSDEMGYIIRNEEGNELRGERYSLAEARIEAETDAMDRGIVGMPNAGDTRFMNSTEDGGTNYREMLLQVPKYEGMTDEFIATGHYDEPNIAVHARTKDRSSDTGIDDVLYVEELQSDWGQRGRNRGFDTPKDKEKLKQLKLKAETVENKLQAAVDENNDFISKFYNDVAEKIGGKKVSKEQFSYSTFYPPIKSPAGDTLLSANEVASIFRGVDQVALTADGKELPIDPSNFNGQDIITKFADLNFRIRSARDERDGILGNFTAEIPIGPFVGNSDKFAELGVKRLINQAAQEGKRYLSFSTGDIQADRWNEEGLKTFYDKIIPKAVEKVAKRLDKDASVTDEFYIDDVDGPRFTIEITPKMREKALEGQPLFNAPVAPLPATSLLGEDKPAMSPEQMYQAGII